MIFFSFTFMLQFVELVHLTMVYHFHDMIDMLINCGYEKGTTLFGYGYDFRQSNRIDKAMAGLRTKLETAYKTSQGKKVNIISHSMGGLLVRCFMSMNHDVFSKYVNKWICIACPFQGAPGCINDSLLTGLQFVYGFESFFFVSRWAMHQLLVECPSIYEMLPNRNFNWTEKPTIQVWRKNPEKDGTVELVQYEASDCVSLFEEALRNNELTYNGKKVALPFNMSVFKWATETRRILDNAELPDTVSFYNIYGRAYDTPYDVW
jgi:pimeloyl-ACP methyl ester carboxylesterase